jgi:hypothetical protein
MPTQTPQWKPGPLEALLGAWTFEITHEGQPVMRGRAEFAWVEGGAFLLQHATADLLPTTPDVWRQNSPFPIVTVIGTDDPSGGFSYLYADGRGIRRVYRMTLADGVWTIRGQAGPRFYQRFQGTFSGDGRTIAAYWERSADGQNWQRDFYIRYTKARSAHE